MAPLYYGGTHGKRVKLNATLYYSLTAGQRHFTKWYTKYGTDGSQQFFFRHAPAWIYCPGQIGLHFLLAACSSDTMYDLSFATVMQNSHCPRCGQSIAGSSTCWELYLCHCTEVASLAMVKQMSFLQEADRVLGTSLALYSMSHHVATLVWAILLQVHVQH